MSGPCSVIDVPYTIAKVHHYRETCPPEHFEEYCSADDFEKKLMKDPVIEIVEQEVVDRMVEHLTKKHELELKVVG